MRSVFVLTAGLIGMVVVAAADTKPTLDDYFTLISPTVLDRDFSSRWVSAPYTADLNGDGHDDLIALGVQFACCGETSPVSQPGRVFFGDGNGNFTAAAPTEFPVDTLKMVNPRKVLFGDLNGDGQLDVFIASHGWDTDPYPGEQNRLYLSQRGGGWRDATDTLPQLSDYSHTAALGDLSASRCRCRRSCRVKGWC